MKRLTISSGLTPPHMTFQYQFRARPVMALSSLSNLIGEWGEKVWITRALGGRRSRPQSPLCIRSFCAGHQWCLDMTTGPSLLGEGQGHRLPPGGQSDCPQVSGHQDMPLGPASKWRPLMQTGGQRPALAGRGPGETPVKPASAPGALRAALPSVSSCSACSPPP